MTFSKFKESWYDFWIDKKRKEWWDSLSFEEKRKLDCHDLTRDELWDRMTPEERNEGFKRFVWFFVIGVSTCSLMLFILWVTGNWK